MKGSSGSNSGLQDSGTKDKGTLCARLYQQFGTPKRKENFELIETHITKKLLLTILPLPLFLSLLFHYLDILQGIFKNSKRKNTANYLIL